MSKLLVALATFAFSMSAMAANEIEAGMESLNTSVEGIDLSKELKSDDFEHMFVKQEKQFPDQIAEMIALEHAAWDEHSQKLEKDHSFSNVDDHRIYRSAFRESYYNGYRYGNRNYYGHQYQSHYNHRQAYEWSYHNSGRRHWNTVSVTISYPRWSHWYSRGYSSAYSWGYHNSYRGYCGR
jgi:hypothetical protein